MASAGILRLRGRPTPVDPPAEVDIVVTNDSEFDAALALDSALSGLTVGLMAIPANGYYTKKTISISTTAQPVTFIALEAGVIIDRLLVTSCEADVVIDGISLRSYQNPMTEAVVTQTLPSLGALTIQNSPRWCGNYEGDTNNTPDPNSNLLKEYGHVRSIVDGSGTFIGGEVINPYIGDNWTGSKTDALNGTITFTIVKLAGAPGSGASGITIDVVDGYLIEASIVVGAGGTGYRSLSSDLETHFLIPGAVRMSDKMHHAFQIQGGATADGGHVTLNDNYVTLCRRGFVARSNFTAIGNTFDTLWGDYIQLAGSNDPTSGATSTVKWNFMTRPGVRGTDYAQPHVDYIQFSGANLRLADWDIDIEGNIMINGVARGSAQGIFMSDMVPPYGYRGRICNNINASKENARQLHCEEARDIIIYGNTSIRYDINDSYNTVSDCNVTIDGAYGSVLLAGNISEVYGTIPSRVNTTLVSNYSVTPDDPTSYGASFTDYDTQPNSIAGVIAAYTSAGAAASKGALRTGLPVDFVNRTVDYSDEPVFVKFDGTIDAPLSTQVTSTPAKIIGGPLTGTWTCSGTGFEIQIDDNQAFSSPTTAATSGTYSRGDWIRFVKTTGAAGVTTENGTVQFNGNATYTYGWSVTTESATDFVDLDNQTTAWSKTTGFTTGTHNKFLMSIEVKIDALGATKTIAGRTGSNDYMSILSTNIFQWNMGANFNLRTTEALGTGWTRIIAVVDMAAQTATVLFNNTATTLSTATLGNGSATIDIAGRWSGGWGIMGTNTGTQILNGGWRYFYWHSWNGATHTLPSVATQEDIDTLYNLFSRDLIGTTGDGPIPGVQPLGFWTADDLTEANSGGGIANKGSVTMPFILQAGTYA